MTITADVSRTSPVRPRLSHKEDLITIAFSAWLIGGLFIDGWAHNNHKPESFFTPWHGIFYSGFTGTLVVLPVPHHGGIPVGYGLGFAGLVAFAAGGWRTCSGTVRSGSRSASRPC